MKKYLILSLMLSALVLSGCAQPKAPKTGSMPAAPIDGGDVMDKNDDDIMVPTGDDDDSMIAPDDSEDAMTDKGVFKNKLVFTKSEGVLKGEGEGFYDKIDGETRVYANFNVEKTEEDYFYEGWLICNDKANSTGKLEFFDGLYENTFASMDLPACQKYILTLEPNDGDPAPAEHIMEGEVQGVAHTENSMDWNDSRFTDGAMAKVDRYTCEDAFQFTLVADAVSENLFYAPVSSGVSTTLMPATAASGAKYSSKDGKLSVWMKADVGTVMSGEEVEHKDCVKS